MREKKNVRKFKKNEDKKKEKKFKKIKKIRSELQKWECVNKKKKKEC